MKKKLVLESLAERKQRGIEKAPSEIKLNKDFIWNEVIGWLIDYLKISESAFTYEEISYGDHFYIIFENAKGMKFYCERKWPFYDYSGNHTISFSIGRESIFTYRLSSYKFSDPKHFVSSFESGEYKNYALPTMMVGRQTIEGGMKEYKNIPNKRKLWKNRIDTSVYLRDPSFQAIVVNEKQLNYNDAIALPKLIIKTLKADEKFKAFIKGQDHEAANKKISANALKGNLTVETVVSFLSSTKPERKIIKSDNAGPWATTGTTQFVDSWKISKLSQKFSRKVADFIDENIQNIFKGLQKNIYAHPLGYYKFIDYSVDDAILAIQASSTTYHN